MKIFRDLFQRRGVIERECPTCKGSGEYTGPVPYHHCLRCGGFGTIILIGDPAHEGLEWRESAL